MCKEDKKYTNKTRGIHRRQRYTNKTRTEVYTEDRSIQTGQSIQRRQEVYKEDNRYTKKTRGIQIRQEVYK